VCRGPVASGGVKPIGAFLMAESLLPGTDAIKRNTLEWDTYHGKYLVRYKDENNIVRRVHTADWNEADKAFEKFLNEMRANCQRNRQQY
jgi:hypothetical protein